MRRATILVADRNPRFLEKTAEILAEGGHTMVGVIDGSSAHRRLSGQLDGILAHAALPGLSGFALCRLAKERDPTLPVIIMFSTEDPRGETEALRAGADNWLVRPLKRLELLYVAREVVTLRNLNLRMARLREEHGRHEPQTSGAEGSQLVQFELFKRLLGIELKRSRRYGFPLSILLASLDREATTPAPRGGVRDLLGDAVRAGIRDIDIPVAFGTADILVVMPHTDLEGAMLVAERIRKRVRATGNTSGRLATTASLGVVSCRGGDKITFSALLAQATRSQKSAQRAGGDRVVAG